MYRKSSKGNPWHDAKGRFAPGPGSKAEQNLLKNNKLSDSQKSERQAKSWNSFGDAVELNSVKKSAAEIDKEKTDEHMNDGKRFYHHKSIKREKHAKEVASLKIDKGLTPEEQEKAVYSAYKEFAHENRYALKHKGKIVVYYDDDNNLGFQVVQSERVTKEVSKKGSKVTRNTSTSMKQFSGYTVEFTKENTVRSCKLGATKEEAQTHLSDFCEKYKKQLSDVDVCIGVWRDEKSGRLFYMPTYRFDNEDDAKLFAKEHKNAKVVNQDDGNQA